MSAAIAALFLFGLLAGAARAGGDGIVFGALGPDGNDVWSAKASGKKARNLSPGPGGPCVAPVASPDGRRLAWIRRDDVIRGLGHLVVGKVRGSGQHDATTGLRGRPLVAVWSPDSRHLYFEFRNAETDRSDLYRYDVRQRTREFLTGHLAVGVSTPGATTTIRVASGGWYAFRWITPERETILLQDPRVLGLARDVVLEAGERTEPGDVFGFAPSGTFYFTVFWPGVEGPQLFRFEEFEVRPDVTGVRVLEFGPRHVAVLHRDGEGDHLRLERRCGVDLWSPGLPVDRLVTGPDGRAALLLLRLPDGGLLPWLLTPRGTTTILEGHDVRTADAVRVARGGRAVCFRLRGEDGVQILHARPRSERAVVLGGVVGEPDDAFSLSRDGEVVLFEETSGAGKSVRVWIAAGGPDRDLTSDAGQPGRGLDARMSPRTGDVLFRVGDDSSAGRVLLFWRRAKNRIRRVSPTGIEVTDYQFAR